MDSCKKNIVRLTTNTPFTLIPIIYHKHQATANSQILTTTSSTTNTYIYIPSVSATMCFHRSFPTKHSRDGINTLIHKQRIANHKNCVTRTLSRFRFFVTSTFIKATGRSRRDEDGIDWYVYFFGDDLSFPFPPYLVTENLNRETCSGRKLILLPSSDIHVFAMEQFFAWRDDADSDVCVRGSEEVRRFMRPRDEEMGGNQ